MIRPMNNHCLIEVIDEYQGISYDRTAAETQRGIVRAVSADGVHLTASAGFEFTPETYVAVDEWTSKLIDRTVLYQQYADAGQTFEEDGKKFALVYWWRLMGVVEEDAK